MIAKPFQKKTTEPHRPARPPRTRLTPPATDLSNHPPSSTTTIKNKVDKPAMPANESIVA